MKNQLRSLGAFALCATTVLLAGCASSPEGKWKINGAGPVAGASGTFEFKKDGALIQTITMPTMGEIRTKGTYKTTGDKVQLNVTDAELSPQVKAMIPPGQEPAIKKMVAEQIAKNGKKEMTFKVENDKLTLTADGKSFTMDKVKE